jgi:23S rRNA (uracil1939-C5)-methyltransferase
MPVEVLRILDASFDGTGRAELLRPDKSTRRVEVPYTLEGEEVEVFLRRGKKRRALFGALQKVITPSPHRIPSRCPHFGVCGGCQSQHMPYSFELGRKEEYLRTLFEPFAAEFHPIIASPAEWGYRNKMEFSFSQNKERQKFFGFIMSGTQGRVFDVTECPLAPDWFVETVGAVRRWWEGRALSAFHFRSGFGSLRSLTLRHGFSSQDRMVILTVSGNPDWALRKEDLETFKECIEQIPHPAGLSIILRIHQAIRGRPTALYEMLLSGPDFIREKLHVGDHDFEFRIGSKTFFQPNSSSAEVLYEQAIRLAAISPSDVVYDLYCGAGVIGMCAAARARKVIGIELSPESCYDGNINLAALGLENVSLFEGDVGKVLAERQGSLEPPQVVILDPPRVGLSPDAVELVSHLPARRLVSISCNPVTQAANIADFVARGWKVCHIQPVDQFPHTSHIENIVICQR